MAESPEEPHLSGLARSIDALFSAAPSPESSRAASAPTLVTPPVTQEEPAPIVRDMLVERHIPAEDPRPLAPHMFPQTQRLETIKTPAPAWAGVGGPSAESQGGAGSNSGAEPVMSFEPTAETVLDLAAPAVDGADTLVTDVAWTTSAPAPPVHEPESSAPPAPLVEQAEPAPPPDGDAFLEALDIYIAGVRGARERVESLAEGLRERLALDPLADAVERLVRFAGDPPDREALDLAAAVMNPAVASRLVQRMGRERDEDKRAEYMALCRRLGRIMANGLRGALTGATEPAVRRVYHETLISMGDVSRPVIEAMAQDENRFLVRDAVVMLGDIGGARAVELVVGALADSDPRVRVEALHALAKLGDAEAGRLALGFLEDADSNVRLAAAVAAGQLGLERALRPLLRLLDEEQDAGKRVLLLHALGELGDPGAVPAIEKHAAPSRFGKTDTSERVAAYRALHQIGTPRARELVQRAASDKDPGVRAALRGLSREA